MDHPLSMENENPFQDSSNQALHEGSSFVTVFDHKGLKFTSLSKTDCDFDGNIDLSTLQLLGVAISIL